MKSLTKITFFLLFFLTIKVSSQVLVTSQQVNLNNSTIIYGCNLIDFGTTVNNNLVINFKLQKPSSQAVGNGTLKVMFLYAPGLAAYAIGTPKIIPSGDWVNNTEITNQIYVNIQASSIAVTGSVIYLEYVSDSNVPYRDNCNYPLKKALLPSFSLSPSNLSLACGDSASKTFSVGASNIPSGATVTYQWYANGWSGPLTGSTVTLTPSSPFVLPSDITVVPSINGVAQTNKICTVTRAGFSSPATISGNTVLCPSSSGIYTLSNFGTNTVVWSINNTNIASTSNASQSQVTVNALAGGIVKLKATVYNQCGQSVEKVFDINIGVPVLPTGTYYGNLWVKKGYIPVNVAFPPLSSATSYVWTISQDLDFPVSCPTTQPKRAKFSNGQTTMTTTVSNVTVDFGNCTGGYIVNCTISNICGATFAYDRLVTVGNSGTNPCFPNSNLSRMSLIENPIKGGQIRIANKSKTDFDSETIDYPIANVLANDVPCFQDSPLLPPPLARKNDTKTDVVQTDFLIYDMFGRQVFSKTIKVKEADEIFETQTPNLPKGNYILNVISGNEVLKKIIVID